VSDETWNAVCDSLKTHPTLEVLDLRVYFTNTATAPVVITSRTQALANMLKVNTSIHTLHLDPRLYREDELFRGSVISYLATNRHWSRVRAIQKTRPLVYRAKVLGPALFAVRTDPNVAPVATASVTATSRMFVPASGQKRKACP
jgi:hypothetical protein